MAKIGTAHIEIKPVLNDEALDLIAERIEEAVAAGVARGIAHAQPAVINVYSSTSSSAEKIAQQAVRRAAALAEV